MCTIKRTNVSFLEYEKLEMGFCRLNPSPSKDKIEYIYDFLEKQIRNCYIILYELRKDFYPTNHGRLYYQLKGFKQIH